MDEARWKTLEEDLAKQPEFEEIGRLMEDSAKLGEEEDNFYFKLYRPMKIFVSNL